MKYGEIRLQDELQFSVYNFELADVDKAWKHLELYESECQALLEKYGKHVPPKRAENQPTKAIPARIATIPANREPRAAKSESVFPCWQLLTCA